AQDASHGPPGLDAAIASDAGGGVDRVPGTDAPSDIDAVPGVDAPSGMSPDAAVHDSDGDARVADACAPHGSQACAVGDAVGTRTCDEAGSSWGPCENLVPLLGSPGRTPDLLNICADFTGVACPDTLAMFPAQEAL